MRKVELDDELFAFVLEQSKFQATIAARTSKAVLTIAEAQVAKNYSLMWIRMVRALEKS